LDRLFPVLVAVLAVEIDSSLLPSVGIGKVIAIALPFKSALAFRALIASDDSRQIEAFDVYCPGNFSGNSEGHYLAPIQGRVFSKSQ
jgi:hypothetical protein